MVRRGPFEALMHSRKFWLAVLALVQTVLFSLIPDFPQNVWLAIDAVLSIVIASIAAEDFAAKWRGFPEIDGMKPDGMKPDGME